MMWYKTYTNNSTDVWINISHLISVSQKAIAAISKTCTLGFCFIHGFLKYLNSRSSWFSLFLAYLLSVCKLINNLHWWRFVFLECFVCVWRGGGGDDTPPPPAFNNSGCSGFFFICIDKHYRSMWYDMKRIYLSTIIFDLRNCNTKVTINCMSFNQSWLYSKMVISCYR